MSNPIYCSFIETLEINRTCLLFYFVYFSLVLFSFSYVSSNLGLSLYQFGDFILELQDLTWHTHFTHVTQLHLIFTTPTYHYYNLISILFHQYSSYNSVSKCMFQPWLFTNFAKSIHFVLFTKLIHAILFIKLIHIIFTYINTHSRFKDSAKISF